MFYRAKMRGSGHFHIFAPLFQNFIELKLSPTYKTITGIAAPLIMGSIAQNIVVITDTAFMGRVGDGETALGAVGLAAVYFLVFHMAFFGLATGVQTLIARRLGEGKPKSVGPLFDHLLGAAYLAGIVGIGWMLYATPQLFGTFLQNPEVHRAITDYLNIRAFELPISFIGLTFFALYSGTADTRILMFAAFLQAALNVLLDYVLIFGKFGFPEMGIEGAALASMVSQLLSMLPLVFYLYSKNLHYNFGLFTTLRFDKALSKSIFNISSPIVLQYIIGLGSWFIFFVFVEQMGKAELAASNIGKTLYGLFAMPLWGVGSAVNTVVSNIYGQREMKLLWTAVKRSIVISWVWSMLVAIVALVLRKPIIGLFTDSEKILALADELIWVVAGALFIASIAIVFIRAVFGIGKTVFSLIADGLSAVIYLIYALYVLKVLKTSLTVAWMAEWVYWIFLGIIFSVFFIRWLNRQLRTVEN